MIKSVIVIEAERVDRKYHLSFPPESKLGEIYDVLREMTDVIIQRIFEEQQKMKPQEEKDDQSISSPNT